MNALLDKANPGDKVKLPPLYKSRLWLIGFAFFKARTRSAFVPLRARPGTKGPAAPRCRSPSPLRHRSQGGNLSNFFALAFAPQSLLSALAAIQFVSNVIFARVLLKERASKRTLLGVATIISGEWAACFHDDEAYVWLFLLQRNRVVLFLQALARERTL